MATVIEVPGGTPVEADKRRCSERVDVAVAAPTEPLTTCADVRAASPSPRPKAVPSTERVAARDADGPTMSRSGYVYFIQVREYGPIKIGFTSRDDRRRVHNIQIASPFELVWLAQIVGSVALERELHRQFRADRLRGEWFRPSVALRDFIVANGGSAPQLEPAPLPAPKPFALPYCQRCSIGHEIIEEG